MAESAIFHEFVSGVPDNPTFQGAVQPQEHWNAPHILTGGQTGDLLTRNPLEPTGWSWTAPVQAVSGALLGYSQGSQSIASEVSPSIDLVNLTFTVSQPTSRVMLLTQASLLDANGTAFVAHPGVLQAFLNNVGLFTVNIHNLGVFTLYFTPLRDPVYGGLLPAAAGNHSLKGRFTGVPNLACTLQFHVLEFSI